MYAGSCNFCVHVGRVNWIYGSPRTLPAGGAGPARGGRSKSAERGPCFFRKFGELSHSAKAHIAIMMQTVGTVENELICATPLAAELGV